MESAIIATGHSLDEVLDKLHKDEKEHKIGRKEMENIFDNIVNNSDGTYEVILCSTNIVITWKCLLKNVTLKTLTHNSKSNILDKNFVFPTFENFLYLCLCAIELFWSSHIYHWGSVIFYESITLICIYWNDFFLPFQTRMIRRWDWILGQNQIILGQYSL